MKIIQLPILCLWIMITSCIYCTAHETSNLETLPGLRTQQYPIGSYSKIVVFSAPRTGSSLTYNVFRFLFQNESCLFSRHDELNLDCYVLRTHRFPELEMLKDPSILFIVPIRNPVDAVTSLYRIHPNPITNLQAFAKVHMTRHQDYILHCENMRNAGRNVIFLRYEDFTANLDVLFQFIEEHFQITIADQDKETIRSGYAVENIYASIENFSNFNEYLPISGFHGKHVTLDGFTPPTELTHWIHHYLPEVKPVYQNYGYFQE